MDLALSDPEMSPREARRLATRVRRESDREKRAWKEVVGMGKEQESGGVVSRMRVRRWRSTGENFGVPMAMGFA